MGITGAFGFSAQTSYLSTPPGRKKGAEHRSSVVEN